MILSPLVIGFTATAKMSPCRSTTKSSFLMSRAPPCGENHDSGDGQGHADDEPLEMEGARSMKQPVRHSESFLRHLEEVKAAWPDDCDSDSAGDGVERGGRVYCTGEPHTDPSRIIQTVTDDDFDWM